MEPNFQPPVTPSPKRNTNSLPVLVGVFALLIALVYVMSVYMQNNSSQKTNFTKDNVEISKTDLETAQGDARVPSGFPEGLYFETDTIFESYTMNYKDKGAVQYTASFTTTKTQKEIQDLYTAFFLKEKYAVEGGQATETFRSYSGVKENDEISVVVNSSSVPTVVQISYLDRQ